MLIPFLNSLIQLHLASGVDKVPYKELDSDFFQRIQYFRSGKDLRNHVSRREPCDFHSNQDIFESDRKHY